MVYTKVNRGLEKKKRKEKIYNFILNKMRNIADFKAV